MIAQISPGEISGVINSLEFAKDLVKEWLEKYKFRDWTKTKTRGVEVTPQLRKERANEVAEKLCNHTAWRTHGRSLKIEDLEDVLLIDRIDNDSKLADIVYRIKTVIRLIFDGSTIYKLYFLDDFKLTKTFSVSSGNIPAPNPIPNINPSGNKAIEGVEVAIKCPKCGKNHTVNGYLDISSETIKKGNLKVNVNVTDNNMFVCDNCKFEIDLKPIKGQIEAQTRRTLTFK